MIVISNPIAIANEINLIHSLFEEGLELFHIRKLEFSENEIAEYIDPIKPEFRSQLVLCQQHHLAENLGISRFHFPENKRKKRLKITLENKIFSTSTHNIEDFNLLSEDFDYAFLSPVFQSISKEQYQPKTILFEDLKSRTNFRTKVVALGGISSEKIKETLENGFDDVALLGTIWNTENPVKQFKLCQNIVRTYSR